MSIIDKVKEILTNYDKITQFTNDIHIDFTEEYPENFGISPMGDILIKEDLLGNQLRQHNFVLYAVNQAFTDYDRLTNSNFLLELNYFLEKIKDIEFTSIIDDIERKCILEKMWSANGMLYSIQNNDLNSGVTYQLQIYAQYKVIQEEE